MYWTIHLEGGPQRVNHAAVVVGSKIYSFGGYSSSEGYEVAGKIDIHVLDTGTLRWSRVYYTEERYAPFKRYGHTVVALRRKIYLWGGRNDLSASNVLHCFDVDTLTWSLPPVKGVIPKAADGHSACIIGDFMYIFGGFEEETESFGDTVYRLNLFTFQWEEVRTYGDPPSSRDFHSASVIGNRMYIFGGRSTVEDIVNGQVKSEFYCNKIVYLNTDYMKWVTPKCSGSPPCGRRSHSTVVYNDELYIIGGYNALTQSHLSDIFRYNPVSGVWTKMCVLGDGPCPRRRHCSCIVGNQLFLFGGSSPSNEEDKMTDAHEDYQKLIDHSDLHVLEFFPTLKRLCQLKIIHYQLNVTCLPRRIVEEIKIITSNNTITRNEFFPRRDFGVFTFSA